MDWKTGRACAWACTSTIVKSLTRGLRRSVQRCLDTPHMAELETAPRLSLKHRTSGLFTDRTVLVSAKSAKSGKLTDGPSIPISSFPSEVQSTMLLFDSDGDLSVSTAELVAAARLLDKHKQRNAMLMRTLGCCVALIALLMCSDLGTSVAAAYLAMETHLSGAVLTVKGTHDAVQVAQSFTPTNLTSYLGDATFRELRYFNATSPTGATVHVQVNGFLRLPPQPCRAPVVQLHTSVGSIHLEGTTLEFDESATSPFFLQAGFSTVPSGPTRRRLASSTDTMLLGFFNTLRALEEHAGPSNCTPVLPTQPARIRALSSRASVCGSKCTDSYGFPLSGLVGTTVIQGQVCAAPPARAMSTCLPRGLGTPTHSPDRSPPALTPTCCLLLSQPYISSEVSLTMETSSIDGVLIARSKEVERLARFPELYNVRVANGTHVFKWVEFGGQKYHCTAQATSVTTAPTMPPGGNASVLESELMPTVAYEGFTFYTSEKRAPPSHCPKFTCCPEPKRN